MLAIEETLILRGLAGFFGEYVPVFLAGKNVYRLKKFKRGQKFVEAPVVRRNCIGRKWLSANSCTPLICS